MLLIQIHTLRGVSKMTRAIKLLIVRLSGIGMRFEERVAVFNLAALGHAVKQCSAARIGKQAWCKIQKSLVHIIIRHSSRDLIDEGGSHNTVSYTHLRAH